MRSARAIAAITTVGALAAAGAWIGLRATGRGAAPKSEARLQAPAAALANTSARSPAPAPAASGAPAPEITAASGPTPDALFEPGYLALVRSHGLAEKQREAEHAFPATEEGAALARVTVLHAFGGTSGPEAKELMQSLALLRSHPAEAFRDLAQGIDELPVGLASEAQFLIQFGARLDVAADRRTEFLEREMSRPPQAGGDNPAAKLAAFSPAIALDSLAELKNDPATVESALREALQAQKDPEVRDTLLSRFAAIAPDRARELKRELDSP